jgi:hypothetical protein
VCVCVCVCVFVDVCLVVSVCLYGSHCKGFGTAIGELPPYFMARAGLTLM